MDLSRSIVKQFADITDTGTVDGGGSTVYGTIVKYNDSFYAQIDGSSVLTPITTTANIKAGDRVTVVLKNHTATVSGNMSDPSASGATVNEIGTKVTGFDAVIADKANVNDLAAQEARIDTLYADNVTIHGNLDAHSATIKTLQADNAIIHGNLEASTAEIETLKTEYADVSQKLTAAEAEIGSLEANKLDAETANITYASISNLNAATAEFGSMMTKKLDADFANIDFTNIVKANIWELYSNSGIIDNLVVGDQTITGELVGVTISGDLIKANTLKADKLVVKGSDGLYYKLNVTEGGIQPSETVTEDDLQNGLHGSNIIAQTITADKIRVSDLVAFDATIGGLKITGGNMSDPSANGSIHSVAKDTINNTTEGIFIGYDGQMNLGGSNQYLKYYKMADGSYKLDISVASLSISGKAFDTTLKEINDDIELAADSANNAMTTAEEASKVATNFLDYTPDSGLQIGHKSSGDWEGFRTRITNTAYDILDSVGTLLARYGANLIELGKNATSAIIKLCGGKGTIAYGQIDNYTGEVLPADTDDQRINTFKISSDDHVEISGDSASLRSRSYNITGEYQQPDSSLSGSTGCVEASSYGVTAFVNSTGNSMWDDSYGDYIGTGTSSYVRLDSEDLYGEIHKNAKILAKQGNIELSAPMGGVTLTGTETGITLENKTFISADGKSAYNDGKTGWYIGTDGTMHGSRANGGPQLLFHYKNAAEYTSRIEETASGVISINGMRFGTNKVLWSGAWHMNADHTATLSEKVSEQTNGIVLIFSSFDTTTSTASDWGWSTHYIPKHMVNINAASGQTFIMSNSALFGAIGAKYLYITDKAVSGNANNTATGTSNGITYANNRFVMRYVIGV